MSLASIPARLRAKFEIYEWKHATTILKYEFPDHWDELIQLLDDFRLCESYISTPGKNKSNVAKYIDSYLLKYGWIEKKFDTSRIIDGIETETPTHKVDCLKDRIALEVEWNNKDPFYDRDLNNFRLLFDLNAISVGIIITRSKELQEIFNDLGRGASYGNSTTHMGKLLDKVNGGGSGGCPLLVIGITKNCYDKTC